MARWVVGIALLSIAAAPPATMTPEQVRLLGESDALAAQAQKAWQAGKQAEAIAALTKAQEIKRNVFGPWHRDTEAAAVALGTMRRARGEWIDAISDRHRRACHPKLQGDGSRSCERRICEPEGAELVLLALHKIGLLRPTRQSLLHEKAHAHNRR